MVSDLNIPIRMSAVGLTEMDDNTNPTKSDLSGPAKACCLCPKTPEEKDRERVERVFRKVFENFLHNAIFLPRYSKQQMEREMLMNIT